MMLPYPARSWLFVTVLLLAVAGIALYFFQSGFTSASINTRPGMDIPVRLQIPALGIDAPVISVGLLDDGGMEVPEHAEDVGWFSPGTTPGHSGSAVLAGHVDTVKNARGVFYNLRLLKTGDDVFVRDGAGKAVRFRVRKTAVYPANDSPLRDIFGSSGGTLLNLITCDGTWRGSGEGYDKRLVVYTEKIDKGEPAAIR